MTQTMSAGPTPALYRENIEKALLAAPCANGAACSVRAPAVIDVMGGIGEDSGALVLTATLNLSFVVSIWPETGADLTVRLIAEGGRGSPRDVTLSVGSVMAGSPSQIIAACRSAGGEWAAPVALAVARALSQGIVARPAKGLVVLVQTDLPPDVDFGRHTVLAAATVEALCRLHGKQVDRATKGRIASDAIEPLTGMASVRTALTALGGMPDGSLLQVRFNPQPHCEPLQIPPGVMLLVVRTHLSRPVTRERMIETRLCTEMSQRVVSSYHNGAADPRVERLSAITPTEYVDTYKDVLPQKITGKQFIAKFGEIRGLNGELDLDESYKIRSRAEHHIYENRRVHEFATAVNRARRTNAQEALKESGERMYASHWSHSQRCGIGGVETDQIVHCIKMEGAEAGLYGAKVTGSGAGGEMVVLMRDDPAAHAALARALAAAQAMSNRPIHTFRGSLAGAELATVE